MKLNSKFKFDIKLKKVLIWDSKKSKFEIRPKTKIKPNMKFKSVLHSNKSRNLEYKNHLQENLKTSINVNKNQPNKSLLYRNSTETSPGEILS